MLKYYMRGVGTGVVVTAVILLLLGKPKELTEEQIRIEAAKLGMVDTQELQEKEETNERIENMIKEAEVNQQQVIEESSTEEKEEQVAESKEELTENKESDKNTETEETAFNESVVEESEEEPDMIEKDDPELLKNQEEILEQEEKKVTDYVQITIESGEVGRTISTKLYEAGLIESIEEYNTFLSGNDYSRKLRAGTYLIPIGATKEEIAEILCKLSD